MKKAVCLLSGGLDSSVTATIAKHDGYELYVLSFDYGQRHKKEIGQAKKIAEALAVAEHKIMALDLTQIGGSALTDSSLAVPERPEEGIPVTYVPARNIIFSSIALGYAEVIGADAIFLGANAVDYSGYPDCRPEFFEAFQRVADVGTKAGVEGRRIAMMTPIIALSKADIIKKGIELGTPLELSWSCYKGGEKACGVCDSCRIRLKGFETAGVADAIQYEDLR